MAFFQEMPWHEGEEKMSRAMEIPTMDNPTVPALSPQLSNHLQIAPLISIGTVDKQGRPWTTLWGGERGMARPLGGGIIGIRTPITGKFDPVVEELVGQDPSNQAVKEEGSRSMVSGLTIDLVSRKRVKMYGRMMAGVLGMRDDEVTGQSVSIAEIQLVLKIEQSLGNCPKYLNSKVIEPAVSSPELISDSPRLPPPALELLAKADLFFVSSAQHDTDMDTNHRGGPPGFLRVDSNEEGGAVVYWPEYSGNRLYQTLGNLMINPLAGICVPDFDTGDMLYLTGKTEILVGQDAAAVLPRSNLCVKLTTTAARFVTHALPFRGKPGESSPYNPTVRYLASEKLSKQPRDEKLQQATLVSQTVLTPTISRFRFSLENTAIYTPGQYVTLDFSRHLDNGYEHMNDYDPQSLNDDFVRTFTVSSLPGDPPNPVRDLKDDEFEITVRKVGVATNLLFQHRINDRVPFEIGVKGFGGEFEVQQRDEKESICFLAAGVGITPILPSLYSMDFQRLKLLWTIREQDVGLVLDVLDRHPGLGEVTEVFLTGIEKGRTEMAKNVEERGARVSLRRLQREDVEGRKASRFYLCTALPLRRQLSEWLTGQEVVFEDFNF
ncbi:related to oxidoreductase, FAD-binding [Ramularia collo-cygni]|uniref:Related to oxidoreductase, FAD-binding n=1 Tax=Ramularia collo-cygni TaxID=112498 RepID=A0A2D3V2T0_9PEZI|nr:related to oxidoreductase, FAD-binding [Ramularia collo-cygni]CZT16794.1 related to oxidoreductase, FAD-binding [Ramularia collo-cygni]